MPWSAQEKGLLIGAVVGCTMAVATLGLEWFASDLGVLVFLLIPGLIVAMAIAGNVHAFALLVATIGNLLFWMLLCLLVGSLIGRIRRRRRPADPDSSTTAG